MSRLTISAKDILIHVKHADAENAEVSTLDEIVDHEKSPDTEMTVMNYDGMDNFLNEESIHAAAATVEVHGVEGPVTYRLQAESEYTHKGNTSLSYTLEHTVDLIKYVTIYNSHETPFHEPPYMILTTVKLVGLDVGLDKTSAEVLSWHGASNLLFSMRILVSGDPIRLLVTVPSSEVPKWRHITVDLGATVFGNHVSKIQLIPIPRTPSPDPSHSPTPSNSPSRSPSHSRPLSPTRSLSCTESESTNDSRRRRAASF